MGKIKYGIIELKTEFPIRKLLVVPHRNEDLTVSYPVFGPDYFKDNIGEMQKNYSHSITGEKISFRKPTTSKSISAAAYGFGSQEEVDVKRDIFDSRWLQLGHIVKTSEGVFTNIHETDEKILKSYLERAKKVKGIYLIKDIAFAPYKTFKQGVVQEYGDFAESGLARALEHTREKTARNLGKIASPKNYPHGVYVYGFDSVKKPILSVASLNSYRSWLNVDGDNRDDDYKGYAFGVLK